MIDSEIQGFLEKLQQYAESGNGELQVPLEYQTGFLGLDETAIELYRGKKVMDFGCSEGHLVYHLRERGVDCDGIDLVAPDEDFFIQRNVTGIYPNTGCVPREDENYDLVVAFQNTSLNRAFTIGGEIRNPANFGGSQADMDFHTDRIMYGQFTVLEALRILKRGGRAVFYPNLSKFRELMGLMLVNDNVEVTSETIPIELVKNYVRWEIGSTFGELLRDIDLPEGYTEALGLDKKTVLIKG